MAIIVFQHEDAEGTGRLGLTLRDHGFVLDVRRPNRPGFKGVPADFDNVEGVIIMGGEANVTDIASLAWMQAEAEYAREAHRRQLPLIGVCLGAQLIAHALGGKVGPAQHPEWGLHRVSLLQLGQTDTIFAGVSWESPQFQAHNQEVSELPPGAVHLATSKASKVQAYKVGLRTYGFQYHFECDRPAIEAVMKSAPAGVTSSAPSALPGSLAEQLDREYATTARLGDRLCVNIASYVFPLQRRRTA